MTIAFTQAATGTASAAGTAAGSTFVTLYTDVGEYYYSTRSLSADQIANAKRWTNEGYMEFIKGAWTDPNTGMRRPHQWSFLHPQATLAVTSADETTALPSSFLRFAEDRLYYPAASGWPPIIQVTPVKMAELLNGQQGVAGRPQCFCLEPITLTPGTGQRWRVRWYPIADGDYTLYYRYDAAATPMTDDAEYPLGGVLHGPTITQWGRAFCEKQMTKVLGPERQLAESMQADSVLQDLSLDAPNLGQSSSTTRRLLNPASTATYLGTEIPLR